MGQAKTYKRSPEHAPFVALLPEYFRKVEQQEADAIARGLPAKGMTAFLRVWFDAWMTQDIDKIQQCVAEDATYIDSSSFQVALGGQGLTAEHCRLVFDAIPDIAFYPQDGTNRSLPYADYFEGQWRITIPWRGIGRFAGAVSLPHFPGVVIPPNGRCVNFIGIDRYILTDDFKITHIDTDWDMLYAAVQLVPFGVPITDLALRFASRPGVFKLIGLLARITNPVVRVLNTVSPTPARIRDTTVQKLFAPDGLVFPFPGADRAIDPPAKQPSSNGAARKSRSATG